MEKILSPEERIRRAEEIYYRRKILEGNRNYARVNISKNKKDFRILKKMIIQITICCLIYSFFIITKNKEYIFSKDVIEKTKDVLSYDINISNLYYKIMDFFNSIINEDNINKNKEIIENQPNENVENQEISKEQNNNENSNVIEEVKKETQEEVELTQMEQDAKSITDTKSLVVPLIGTITSRFGPRESENPKVSKNHTGIDIAVNEGTIFTASMEGIVEIVSSVRRIRKSYRNCKW